MIPQTTEERTHAYTATPEFRDACASIDKACVNEVPDLATCSIYRSAFTPLQDRTRILIQNALPITLEFTAQALFQEIEDMIRILRQSNESMAKDLSVVQSRTEEDQHNRVMRKKLCEFLETVAFVVDEKFVPVMLPYPDREFMADRMICKLYRLLAPGNLKSHDCSGETATGSVSPEPHSAEWFRAQRQADHQESKGIVPVKLWNHEDHNRAVAAVHGVPVPVTDEDLAGVDYEELKELRFQNAELSRQLESAKASMTTTLTNEVTGWHIAAEKYAAVVEAWRKHLDILTGCALSELGIEAAADLLKGRKSEIDRLRGELKNAPNASDIQAVQKERDELGELVSHIKVVLAKHLSDDPLFNIVPVAEIIDQKLGHLKTVSERANQLANMEARIRQQASRLVDAKVLSSSDGDMAAMVQNLVAYRLGAEAAEQQKDAKDSSSSSEASSTIAPKAVVSASGDYAVVQHIRSPFVKVDGHVQFRADNPGIDWVKVGDFDIPVPLVKSAILMAGGSNMPDGQPIHLSMVSKQLSLLSDAGTAIGRCFGGIIGNLRAATATAGDVDEAIAKRLEKHRVVWPSPEGA